MYARHFETTNNIGIVNIDNGSLGGTIWICSYMKDKNFSHFEKFGGPLRFFYTDNYQTELLFIFLKKTQHIVGKLCGVFCLYFFYLKEK